GDYAALELINLYKAYRALVRAKVSLFRLYQEQDAVERKVVVRQYRSYANLAESYSAIPSRFLAVTHGVSASGKSHVALRLVEALGMLRLRSDVERKRLHGEQPEQSNGLGAGIYSAEAGEATYQRLHTLAEAALNAGFSVVIDATYLKQEQRQAAWQVAEATGVPFLIIDCEAADAVIEQWLAQRQAEGSDPSDATMEVVKAQQASREPLSESERLLSRRLDTADASSLVSLLAAIRQRLPGPGRAPVEPLRLTIPGRAGRTRRGFYTVDTARSFGGRFNSGAVLAGRPTSSSASQAVRGRHARRIAHFEKPRQDFRTMAACIGHPYSG